MSVPWSARREARTGRVATCVALTLSLIRRAVGSASTNSRSRLICRTRGARRRPPWKGRSKVSTTRAPWQALRQRRPCSGHWALTSIGVCDGPPSVRGAAQPCRVHPAHVQAADGVGAGLSHPAPHSRVRMARQRARRRAGPARQPARRQERQVAEDKKAPTRTRTSMTRRAARDGRGSPTRLNLFPVTTRPACQLARRPKSFIGLPAI
jgi:hypothetical protein